MIMAKYNYLCLYSMVLHMIFGYIGGVKSPVVDDVNKFQLMDDDSLVIKSDFFPQKCCVEKSYQVDYIGRKFQHMRLEFTDIDIPLGSAIVLFDDDEQLLEQPEIVDRNYVRKGFPFNGSSIKIMFKPINNKLTSYYAGFRAEIKAVPELLPSQWIYWPTSEGCMPVNDVMIGGILQLHNDPSIYESRVRSLPSLPLHDCIWVLKLPTEFKHSGHLIKLFLRIDEMKIEDELTSMFEMVVKEDNSEGTMLKTFTGKPTDTYPVVIESESDMYIRLKLPYTTRHGTGVDRYAIRITYGIFSETDSLTHSCKLGPLNGFNCITPQWCVPLSYKCNGVVNCASIEDEKEDTCVVVATTTVSKVVAATPSTSLTDSSYRVDSSRTSADKCTYHEAFCYENERCYSIYDYSTECKSSENCKSFEKVCEDGSCVHVLHDCKKEKFCGFNKKKCDDGRCISTWQSCTDHCYPTKKKCADGSCVPFSSRCPRDLCPSYEPFKCVSNGVCIYESYQCDGNCYCTDCSDEDDCSANSGALGYLGFLAVGIILCSACTGLCRKKYRANAQRETNNLNTNAATYTSGTPMQPVVSGAAPQRSAHVVYTAIGGSEPTPGIQYDIPQTPPTAPPSASAPPPYGEAVNTSAYPPPPVSQDSLPPPPSYQSVTASQNT